MELGPNFNFFVIAELLSAPKEDRLQQNELELNSSFFVVIEPLLMQKNIHLHEFF